MSSAPSASEIWRDARWLVQAVDPNAGLARVIEMSPAEYREASFLDDRMLQQPRNAHLLGWTDVMAAMPRNARTDARWIFHIGHVGSTLVARLLGELDGVLAVREPRALRDLAQFPAEARTPFVEPLQRLYSRTFAPDEAALVKTTSFVSEIAAELVPVGQRALFMYAKPQAYIEGILAGENSRKELQMLAQWRGQRMQQRVQVLDAARESEAHLAAAAWACEATALVAAEGAMPPGSVEWADFDGMLDSMSAHLKRVAAFFGWDAHEERIAEIATGPLMRRYSKALEFDYSPELRRELLGEARRDHGENIRSALGMLARTAQNSPLLARALDRAHSGT